MRSPYASQAVGRLKHEVLMEEYGEKSARTSVYKNQKRHDKGLSGSKKGLQAKNSAIKTMLEEFRVDRDKWKAEAKKLTEKCSLLTRKLDHIGGHTNSRTCTKATTTFAPHTTPTNLPADMRIFPWCIMKSSIKTSHVFLGKGVFGKCYLTQLGPMKVCVKVYHVQRKYSETFFNEVWILHMLVHDNLPLLLGVYDSCKNPKMTVMSYHSFNVQMESLTIHTSLKSTHLTKANWKQVLLGCISALCYLVKKQVIHNDIKADNVLVEYLAPEYKQCRSVLIDFGKACCVSEAKLYHLSPEEKEKYKVFHPQIAPEVHNGIHKQSFASDIYSFGRIMQRVNHKLEIPVLNSLADQCLGAAYDKRPSAQQLLTFLSNLFEE